MSSYIDYPCDSSDFSSLATDDINNTQSSSASGSSHAAGKRPAPPHNLRFQRRTSEKAYLEGNYRDGAMDYSTSAGYAAGASPWANSPEQSRNSLDQSQPGLSQGSAQLGPPADGDFERQQSSQQSEGWRSDSQPSTQWAPQQRSQHQEEVGGDGGRTSETHQAQTPSRYHGVQSNAPPAPRQPQPQYKLQIKITGLERTAKKDPILRFDAYV